MTVWHIGEHTEGERVKLASKRKRAPMGGHAALACPASCRAGQMYASLEHSVVKRMAGSTAPAATSSASPWPGRLGRPAASADVQASGRRASLRRFQIAPDPAIDPV